MGNNYNIIAIFDKTFENILMCKREKEPYKGLYNFVGGKIEYDECSIDAAYRELREETGITKDDIYLFHLMDFKYYLNNSTLEVYVGKLNRHVTLKEELNSLEWISSTENFFPLDKFAGDGNIGHIMNHILLNKDTLFK